MRSQNKKNYNGKRKERRNEKVRELKHNKKKKADKRIMDEEENRNAAGKKDQK